jgi:hypothetical protein
VLIFTTVFVAMPLRAFLLFLPTRSSTIKLERVCRNTPPGIFVISTIVNYKSLPLYSRYDASQCPSGHFCYFYGWLKLIWTNRTLIALGCNAPPGIFVIST